LILRASIKFELNTPIEDFIMEHYCILKFFIDFEGSILLSSNNKIDPFSINAILFWRLLFLSSISFQSRSFISINPSPAIMKVVALQISAYYKIYFYFSTFIHNKMNRDENFFEGVASHFLFSTPLPRFSDCRSLLLAILKDWADEKKKIQQ
jgi:hypothetical protein